MVQGRLGRFLVGLLASLVILSLIWSATRTY
jgi:hypothetical protein